MQLVERHIRVNSDELEQVCFKSARLFNFINYHKRQVYFGKQKDFKEYEVSGLCAEFNQEDYRALPAQCSQQVIKQVFKGWKSFWAALKEYKKNPGKFLGRPKPPRYKDKDGYNILTFTDQQVRIKDGYIHFPKGTISPLKTKLDNICQVRIVPNSTCFIIEVVYEKKEAQHENVKSENVLSIDMGLNNICTAIDNVGNQPFIINGGMLKSINAYFNRKRAKLMVFIGDRGTSNRIERLTHKRNRKVEDRLHKISHFILSYCLHHGIGKVVIGKNEHWKQKINIGSRNNQNFVSIPHAKLIDKIAYKLKLNGIELIVQEESYTSKCDHLAFEPIQKQAVYSGKRIKRGLFRSKTGKAINADVNGAIGILLKSKVVRECGSFIRSITDTGLAFRPVKVNIL